MVLFFCGGFRFIINLKTITTTSTIAHNHSFTNSRSNTHIKGADIRASRFFTAVPGIPVMSGADYAIILEKICLSIYGLSGTTDEHAQTFMFDLCGKGGSTIHYTLKLQAAHQYLSTSHWSSVFAEDTWRVNQSESQSILFIDVSRKSGQGDYRHGWLLSRN